MDRLTRRAALEHLVIGGAGLMFLPTLAQAQDAGRVAVPFEDIPEGFFTKRPGTFPHPGQATVGIDLRQIAPTTAPDDLFLVAHYNIPEIDAAAWRLTVDGSVGRPLTFTLDDLKRRPRVERTLTFECGGNREQVMHRMVGNATWAGCSLKAVLEEARPGRDVLEAVFWGTDEGKETIRATEYVMQFGRSMTLADALAADAILAWEVNGQPLPVVHGFPLRLVVPGWYGVANVKWLSEIHLQEDQYLGKYQARWYRTVVGETINGEMKWTERAVTHMQLKSFIARVTKAGDQHTVLGVVLNDGTPIKAVEVKVDDGAWQPATLDPATSGRYSWKLFRYTWRGATPGEHTLVSRVIDVTGRIQPTAQDLESKKSFLEDNSQFPRTLTIA